MPNDFLSNIVIINLDVLDAGMKLWIDPKMSLLGFDVQFELNLTSLFHVQINVEHWLMFRLVITIL